MSNIKLSKIKLIIFGDLACGKTAMAASMTGKKSKYDLPTIGVQPFINNKEDLKLEIWDTSGSRNYIGIYTYYDTDISYYVVCVDLSKPYDEYRIRFWLEYLHITGPIMVVGTKKDKRIQNVSYESYCDENGMLYSETTINDHTSYEETLRMMIEDIERKKPPYGFCETFWKSIGF